MTAEPVLRRTKTSAAVVEYVQRRVFDGRLRCGDRIDVDRISEALGVSPTPVREALMLLERDGVVTTRVHRAAYVQFFDARTLRADFHVLGLLSGVAVARMARDHDPHALAQLDKLLDELKKTRVNAVTQRHELVSEIKQFQHQTGATPRLLAELRGIGGFLDWAIRNSDQRTREEIIDAHASVRDAIAAGDERAASTARLADVRTAGEQVIADLIRRGVLREDGTNPAAD